jgi:hypothetical protein
LDKKCHLAHSFVQFCVLVVELFFTPGNIKKFLQVFRNRRKKLTLLETKDNIILKDFNNKQTNKLRGF